MTREKFYVLCENGNGECEYKAFYKLADVSESTVILMSVEEDENVFPYLIVKNFSVDEDNYSFNTENDVACFEYLLEAVEFAKKCKEIEEKRRYRKAEDLRYKAHPSRQPYRNTRARVRES